MNIFTKNLQVKTHAAFIVKANAMENVNNRAKILTLNKSLSTMDFPKTLLIINLSHFDFYNQRYSLK